MAWYNFWKDDWRLVKSLSIDIKFEKIPGQIYFHLFESNKGKRRMDVQCTLSLPSYIKLEKEAMNSQLYQSTIYRWLNGRYDPEIPRYSDIPEEETVNALKGKI